MPLIALGVLGAVGGIAGAVGSTSAASTQAQASESAAQLQYESEQQALQQQQSQWQTTQNELQPFLQTGTGAEYTLGQLTRTPGEGLLTPFTEQFQAPTAEQAAATPGYQFALKQGQQAIENSAAARGNLLSSTTLKGLDQYSQGLASTNYQQTYQNALNEFQQRYNIFNQNQTNQFNRLSAVAGGGQTTAQTLGQLGSANTGQVANILLGSSGQIGQTLQNAAAARASGYVGATNALSGAASSFGNAYLLSQLFGPNAGANNPYGGGSGQIDPMSYPANYPLPGSPGGG